MNKNTTGVMLKIPSSKTYMQPKLTVKQKRIKKEKEKRNIYIQTLTKATEDLNRYINLFENLLEDRAKKLIESSIKALEQIKERVTNDNDSTTQEEDDKIKRAFTLLKVLKKIESFHDKVFKHHLQTEKILSLAFRKIDMDVKSEIKKGLGYK